MKKAFVILSLVLGLCAGGYAQMFNRDGSKIYSKGDDENPLLPGHNLPGNQDANQGPIGSGALLLIGFGAAYAMSKKKKD